MTSKLDVCRTRLSQVTVMRDQLNREILDYFHHTHPHKVYLEPDPANPNEGIIFVEPPDELPAHWAIVLGHIFHDLRASLDNLAWLLAEDHSGPAPWPIPKGSPWRRLQFPIYDTETAFDAAGKDWGSLLDPYDWAVLDSYQPHPRANFQSGHYFVWLQELNNADKHRVLHLLALYHTANVNPEVWVAEAGNCEVESIDVPPITGICRGKTELGRVHVKPTGPKPFVRVNEQLGFEITIDHPAAPNYDGMGIVTWILIYASQVVERFAAKFP